MIEKNGLEILIIDFGVMGETAFAPDITRQKVAKAGRRDLATLASGPYKDEAMRVMVAGLVVVVRRLFDNGRLYGIIGLGGIMVDIRDGFFRTNSGLELADFQSAPALKTVGPFFPSLSGGTYTITLGSSTFDYINKLTTNGGVTQIRLLFKQDDNNDSIANTLNLASGDNSTVDYRPTLVIVYTTP